MRISFRVVWFSDIFPSNLYGIDRLITQTCILLNEKCGKLNVRIQASTSAFNARIKT